MYNPPPSQTVIAMKYIVFDRKKWGKGEWNGGSKTPSKTIIGENPGGGGVVLPSGGLMGLCHWMGSHFQNWIDYYGVAFL